MKIKCIVIIFASAYLSMSCSTNVKDKRQQTFDNGLPQEEVKPINKAYPVKALKLKPATLDDGDRDGVIDPRDNCSKTPSHNAVDNKGCTREVDDIKTTNIAIYFPPGKSEVTRKYHNELERIATLHKGQESHLLLIEGYTDNKGTRASNLLLSKKRAAAVANELVEKFGVNRDEILISFYGSDKPIADNKTAAGRTKNRRMVAHVVSTERIVIKNWDIWSVDVGNDNTEVKEYYRLTD